MKSLRILIYSDHFYPSIGGSENYALDLASELFRNGHKVGVITAEKTSGDDKFQFDIFRLHKPFSIKRMNINFIEVLHIIRFFNPDIFHINYQTGGENIIIPFLKLMKIPIFITYHADHVVILGKLIDEFQMATVFRLASMIMVQSEHDARKFKNRGFSRNKLKLFRFNGIDTNKYHCKMRGSININFLKLLCVGRLDDGHKYKGVIELIRGLIEMKKENICLNLSLTIIGEGELRKSYEDECRIHDMDNIKFMGNLNDNEIIEALCQTNFLILPSISNAEGFGRVALEALSCGTPVIVSKYAGISDLIKKYNAGIIYDPNNFNFLVNQLNGIARHSSTIEKFISNGRKLIVEENLTLGETTKKIVEMYNHISRK